jgi:hypothetical protein
MSSHGTEKFGNKAFSKARVYRLVRVYLASRDMPNYIECDFLSVSMYVLGLPTSAEDYDLISTRRAALSYVKMLN